MVRIRIKQSDLDPDPHQIEKPDQDQYQGEKQDLDPYQKGLDPQHCSELHYKPKQTARKAFHLEITAQAHIRQIPNAILVTSCSSWLMKSVTASERRSWNLVALVSKHWSEKKKNKVRNGENSGGGGIRAKNG